jgi:putative transposase
LIGSVGESNDDALAESVIGLYENKRVNHDGPFRALDDLEPRTWSWVRWFNHQCIHSSIV